MALDYTHTVHNYAKRYPVVWKYVRPYGIIERCMAFGAHQEQDLQTTSEAPTLSTLRNRYPLVVNLVERAVDESSIATTAEGTSVLVFAVSMNVLLRDVLRSPSVRASVLLEKTGGPTGNAHRHIDVPGKELALYALAQHLPGETRFWIEERGKWGVVLLDPVGSSRRVLVDPLDQTSTIPDGVCDQSTSMIITDAQGILQAGTVASLVDERILFIENLNGAQYVAHRLSLVHEGGHIRFTGFHVSEPKPRSDRIRVGILNRRLDDPSGLKVCKLIESERWDGAQVRSFGGWALLQLGDTYDILIDPKGQPRKEMQWAWMALLAGHAVSDLNGKPYEASDFERMAREAHDGNMEDRFPYVIARNAAILRQALEGFQTYASQ